VNLSIELESLAFSIKAFHAKGTRRSKPR